MISLKSTGLALALSVTLAACGGGGETGSAPGDSPTSSAPASAPAASAPDQAASQPQVVKSNCRDVRVTLFGDSAMQGSQIYTLDANGRSALGRYLDAHSTRHVVLIDKSAPGTTSTQMVAGWDGVSQGEPWPYKVDADLVVVNHGLNDSTRTPIDQYESNLRVIAGAGTPVLFQTANPVPGLTWMAGYADTMKRVAQDSHNSIADVFGYVMLKPSWEAMIPDGAHPSYELYLALAAGVIGPALLPLVEAVPCT